MLPEIKYTSDFMWHISSHGLGLKKMNGKLCITVYEDSNYQIFYNEDRNAVLNKKEERVYDMTIDAWTNMVLKIDKTLNSEDWDEQRSIWYEKRKKA